MPSLVTSRRPALGFIFITLVLDILGIGIIVPVLPKLVEHFKGGSVEAAAHTLGFLSALYALMQFLFAPVLGSLSDKVGRRPVILFSLFGSGVDYFFLAFAPSLAWFFVGRMISGITGSSFSAATAYIADVSPPEKRAANFGLVGAAFGLGFILGPLIGGILGQYGLHVPFVVAGCPDPVRQLLCHVRGSQGREGLAAPESIKDKEEIHVTLCDHFGLPGFSGAGRGPAAGRLYHCL